MTGVRIAVAGEVLWDVFPDAEYLGGASLNFAVHARRMGHHPLLISAVGNDERGRAACARIEAFGLDARWLRVTQAHPTGTVTVAVDREGQPTFTIHRPAAYDDLRYPREPLDAGWIYYGTLLSANDGAREGLLEMLRANPGARRFYDVNLRRDCYTPAIVLELLAHASVVKLNDDEMAAVRGMCGFPPGPIEQFCRDARERYGFDAVCVTRGERGCALLAGGEYEEVPGVRVPVADTVGAGDAFAAGLLHGLAQGWPAWRIGSFANRAGAIVASRPGGTPDWNIGEIAERS